MFLFSSFLFLLLFICGHLLLLLFDGIELFCWMLLSAFISLSLFLWSDCLFLMFSLYGSNLVLIYSDSKELYFIGVSLYESNLVLIYS